MTALRVLVDEKFADRAQNLGEIFRAGILALKSPLVKEVRGNGLLDAVVIDEDKSCEGRTAWQFCSEEPGRSREVDSLQHVRGFFFHSRSAATFFSGTVFVLPLRR
jgi:acetylornithine/succinyldiaminopimelate/putrescine aminotransferase